MDENESEEFISMAGHSLKTPLISIMGFSQLLANGKCDDKKEVYLKMIYQDSIRLKNEIEKLQKDLSGVLMR